MPPKLDGNCERPEGDMTPVKVQNAKRDGHSSGEEGQSPRRVSRPNLGNSGGFPQRKKIEARLVNPPSSTIVEGSNAKRRSMTESSTKGSSNGHGHGGKHGILRPAGRDRSRSLPAGILQAQLEAFQLQRWAEERKISDSALDMVGASGSFVEGQASSSREKLAMPSGSDIFKEAMTKMAEEHEVLIEEGQEDKEDKEMTEVLLESDVRSPHRRVHWEEPQRLQRNT